MKNKPILTILCVLATAGCAASRESPYAGRMNAAGDEYLACISREAEKDMKNPTSAEDIAIAAHARCWSAWTAYREATNANYTYGAEGRAELQYARDKAEGHLRQFEREARRTVVDTVAQRSLGGAKPAP